MKDYLHDNTKKVNQKKLLQEVLKKLDLLIEQWNPKFVIDEKTESQSLAILNNFKKCRDLLTNATFPKSNSHMVGVYYTLIMQSFKKINEEKLLTTYGGDVLLKPLSLDILEKVTNWTNLPN